MDPTGLAVNVASILVSICKSIQEFYKNYRSIPAELEKFTQQAEIWKKVLYATLHQMQKVSNMEFTGKVGENLISENVVLMQVNTCTKHLQQLADDLKMPSPAAQKHS